MASVYLPPENYSSHHLSHNLLPPAWLDLINNDKQLIVQDVGDIGQGVFSEKIKELE